MSRPTLAQRIDALQRRHPALALPWAVQRAYTDVRGGRHAALLTYYGFLSLFPILLMVVAVLSRLLASNPELRSQVVTAIVPDQAQATVDGALQQMPSSGIPLLIGVVGLLLSALGIVTTASETLLDVVTMPYRDRPRGWRKYARLLGMLLLLMAAAGAIGGASVLLTTNGVSPWREAATGASALAIVFLLVWSGAKVLLPGRAPLGRIWLPALVAAVVVVLFAAVGALLIPYLVQRSGAVYGAFATIVGLLAFIAFVARALVYTAVLAVVRSRGLVPRTLGRTDPTDADERMYAALARQQEWLPGQVVESRWE